MAQNTIYASEYLRKLTGLTGGQRFDIHLILEQDKTPEDYIEFILIEEPKAIYCGHDLAINVVNQPTTSVSTQKREIHLGRNSNQSNRTQGEWYAPGLLHAGSTYQNCTLKNAVCESMILRHAKMQGCVIGDSLIGPYNRPNGRLIYGWRVSDWSHFEITSWEDNGNRHPSVIDSSTFKQTRLTHSRFEAEFRNTRFEFCNLKGADFRGSTGSVVFEKSSMNAVKMDLDFALACTFSGTSEIESLEIYHQGKRVVGYCLGSDGKIVAPDQALGQPILPIAAPAEKSTLLRRIFAWFANPTPPEPAVETIEFNSALQNPTIQPAKAIPTPAPLSTNLPAVKDSAPKPTNHSLPQDHTSDGDLTIEFTFKGRKRQQRPLKNPRKIAIREITVEDFVNSLDVVSLLEKIIDENPNGVRPGTRARSGTITRMKNCLLNKNITHPLQLLFFRRDELLNFPNVGRDCLRYLKAVFDKVGLQIGQFANNTPPNFDRTNETEARLLALQKLGLETPKIAAPTPPEHLSL